MTPDEKRAHVAQQAQGQAALDARTPDEVKGAANPSTEPEATTVSISEIKMLNLPQTYGVAGLHLYLRGIPSTRTGELVESIFKHWPALLFIASKIPLTVAGGLDIPGIAYYYQEIQRNVARGKLPEPEDDAQREKQEAALNTLVVSPRDVLAELTELQDAPPGEPSAIESAIPGMAQTVWMLAADCPQNAEWSVDKVAQVLRETFRLPDFAHLARVLLEVNSIGGGFADDLCERFTAP